jgi:hypothetical protein
MSTTKKQVRQDFKHARFLMQEANRIMKSKEQIDWSNDADACQIALELSASASTFLQYVTDQQDKGAK